MFTSQKLSLESSGKKQLQATLREVSQKPELLSGQKVQLCVSVGQSKHYGAHLKATLILLSEINSVLKERALPGIAGITLSANGVLQRHNFWYFACQPKESKVEGSKIKPLADQELQAALKDLPTQLNEEGLAKELAARFYPHALQAERAYLTHCDEMLNKSDNLPLLLQLHRISFNMVGWEHWREDGRYSKEYQALVEHYKSDTTFQTAFVKTRDELFHEATRKKIAEAGARIKKLRPDLEKLDFEKVAEYASLAYLWEECPIIPGPLWAGFHVVYTQAMTPAFKATAAWSKTPVNWHMLNFKELDFVKDSNPIRAVVAASPLIMLKQNSSDECKVMEEAKVQQQQPRRASTTSEAIKKLGRRVHSDSALVELGEEKEKNLVRGLEALIQAEVRLQIHQKRGVLLKDISHDQKMLVLNLFKPLIAQAVTAALTDTKRNAATPPPPLRPRVAKAFR